MSTTLHKLLAHSAAVVDSCHLPIGMMSEEAAEAANKRLRQYRMRHTRKDSRLHTMSDLFGYMLVASDPLVSSHGLQRRRRLCSSRHGKLQPEVLTLLAEPESREAAAGTEEGVESDTGCEEYGGSDSDSSSSNSGSE